MLANCRQGENEVCLKGEVDRAMTSPGDGVVARLMAVPQGGVDPVSGESMVVERVAQTARGAGRIPAVASRSEKEVGEPGVLGKFCLAAIDPATKAQPFGNMRRPIYV